MPREVFYAVLLGPAQEFTRSWLAARSKTSITTAETGPRRGGLACAPKGAGGRGWLTGRLAAAVPRPLTVLLVAALAIPGIGACGGDDGDDQAFQDDFPALSERLQSLGEELGNTLETAQDATNEELATEFENFAQELGELRQELEDLEPPEDLADEREDLVAAMGEVRSSLESIASAADEGDPQAAREATVELLDDSGELRDARQALGQAVRQDE